MSDLKIEFNLWKQSLVRELNKREKCQYFMTIFAQIVDKN